MSAYIVFTRVRIFDEAEFAHYAATAPGTMAAFDARVLAAYGEEETLEGEPNQGTVILEFADVATAKAWYNSPAYVEACAHRFKSAEYKSVLVQGI